MIKSAKRLHSLTEKCKSFILIGHIIKKPKSLLLVFSLQSDRFLFSLISFLSPLNPIQGRWWDTCQHSGFPTYLEDSLKKASQSAWLSVFFLFVWWFSNVWFARVIFCFLVNFNFYFKFVSLVSFQSRFSHVSLNFFYQFQCVSFSHQTDLRKSD